MKPVLFTSLLLLCACAVNPEKSGSGGAGSGSEPSKPEPPKPEPPKPEGQGQGGGPTYQPCDDTCKSDCFSVPDGDKTIGLCTAPCQTKADCPALADANVVCTDNKCSVTCGTGSCPTEGMKCVTGVCGYPLPAPQ